MNKKQNQSRFGGMVWKFFASVRLTIITFLSLATTSIIGTVVLQNQPPDYYLHRYGEVLYKVFFAFDLFDMYHSWWFRFLVSVLVLNIIVCSIDKLSATWKIIFPDEPVFKKKIKTGSIQSGFVTATPPEKLEDLFQKVAGKRYSHTIMEKSETGFFLYAEKGRWTRMGVYAVHLSVVLLLIGSLIGSLFGFDASVMIPEGESTNRIFLQDSNRVLNLDFQIRCDDFSVSFYDSGAPKEFRSALTLLKDDKPVITKDIIVNDPLRYEGINLFQSNYGKLPPRNITLVLQDRKTGEERVRKTVQLGEKIILPDNQGEFILTDFSDQSHFNGRNIGDAFTGSLFLQDKGTFEVFIPYPFPKIDFQVPDELQKIDRFQTQSTGAVPDRISLSVTSVNTGMVYALNCTLGETQTIPEGLGRFTLQTFQQSYNFKGHSIGDAFIGTLHDPDGTEQTVILPVKFSQFDRMRKGKQVIAIADLQQKSTPSDLIVSVTDFQEHYYTGLQVTKDPGVWMVYIGFIMMILGCYVTFFLSHQQVCIEAIRKGEQTEINISGSANKNKFNVQKKIERLSMLLNE